MTRIDEIKMFVENHFDFMVNEMYRMSAMIYDRKINNGRVCWTFKDGSFGDVHFRMSNGYNYDKAASIPAYTFNGDGANPNFTLCMSCDGKIFAIIETDVVAKKYKDIIDKKAVKGFVGFDIYKNFEDGVKLIYA